MTDEEKAETVAEWRRSGKTSEDFARARDFAAPTLRRWAYEIDNAPQLKVRRMARDIEAATKSLRHIVDVLESARRILAAGGGA